MAKLELALLVLVLVEASQAQCFPRADSPSITKPVLEKGKPINISEHHTHLHISGLTGTIYSDTFSQLKSVTELRICASNIKEIEAGALCSAPNLKRLVFEFGNAAVTKKAFENCSHLEELILQGDIRESSFQISEDALEDIPGLKKLSIQSYNMSRLGPDVLKFPRSLTNLFFAFCDIRSIDSHALANLQNLEELGILQNTVFSPPSKNLFKETPKLKKIFLGGDAIQNLTWEDFEGLNSLEVLHLKGNNIAPVNAAKVAKNLPNLKVLNIVFDAGSCKQAENFSNELKRKTKASFDVSVYYSTCQDENLILTYRRI